MSPPLIAVLALIGLLLGWPLRALIFRYAVPATAPPRTTCPSCGQSPDSVFARTKPPASTSPGPVPTSPGPVPTGAGRRARLARLSARCPACDERAGPPPLAVAATTAAAFGALAVRVYPAPAAYVHPGLVLAAVCWLAACSVPLVFIDAAVHRLPDVLTVPAYVGTVVLLLAAAATASPESFGTAGGHPWPVLLRAVLGGFALAAFYFVLLLVSPASMGLGDVKLAASLGTMLAWFGWRILLVGGFAGFALAGLYGAALLVTHRATRKAQIPFGPFMIAGAFLVILIR